MDPRRRLVVAAGALVWVVATALALPASGGALAQVDPVTSTTEAEPTTTELPTTTEAPTTVPETTTTTAPRPTTTTSTTAPPPPPPPEDRTPPRQPGQAPAPEDTGQTQAIDPGAGDMPGVFPLLSIGGFAALGGLLGAQWFMTKPGRRGPTL